MTVTERQLLIRVMANLDDVVQAIGYKRLRAAGVAKAWNKAIEILNDLINPGEEHP